MQQEHLSKASQSDMSSRQGGEGEGIGMMPPAFSLQASTGFSPGDDDSSGRGQAKPVEMGEAAAEGYKPVVANLTPWHSKREKLENVPDPNWLGGTIEKIIFEHLTIVDNGGSFQVSMRVTADTNYGVASRPMNGQQEIESSSSPRLRPGNYEDVYNDLRPIARKSGYSRPSTLHYYNHELVRKHEEFHADDYYRVVLSQIPTLKARIVALNASSSAMLRTKINETCAAFVKEVEAKFFPEAEKRAHSHSNPGFQNLANAIKSKGDKGAYG